MDKHYLRWSSEDLVEYFASKKSDEFFETEKRFLDEYHETINSVLDIGCASGNMIALLNQYIEELVYVGIDIAEENIKSAKINYPNYDFHLGNALDINLEQRFDLVNATGVCQHEPDFERLIQHMLDMSKHFVMVDVKFSNVPDNIIDIEKSYCQVGDDKLYFVLLSWNAFIQYLMALPGVSEIQIFGYETPKSSSTHILEGDGRLVSAGIFLVKGVSDRPKITINLPDWLDTESDI